MRKPAFLTLAAMATVLCFACDNTFDALEDIKEEVLLANSPELRVTGVSLDESSTRIEIGVPGATYSEQLTATVMPTAAINKDVAWTSSDPSVAVVSSGLIVAVKPGQTTVIATTDDGGKTVICTVTVVQLMLSLSLDQTSLSLTFPGAGQLAVQSSAPSNATDPTVVWSSGDAGKVSVDASGTVTAIYEPGCTITATASDGGGATASCLVTVTGIAPTVGSTAAASDIRSTSAVSGGTISSDGGSAISDKGVCWSQAENPTTAGAHSHDGIGPGAFISPMSGLAHGTTYYARAYATNNRGTEYGPQISFNTPSTPDLTTSAVDVATIYETTAAGGGFISNQGGYPVTARGVCWSTNPDPTIALITKTSDGTGTGAFTSDITGLARGTTYHVRAYATNDSGTAYGGDVTFTTDTLPSVFSSSIVSIAPDSATVDCFVGSDGGDLVADRGVCWDMVGNPTISNSHTHDGSGTGSFMSTIPGLSHSTHYHVRAYATNAVGPAYGPDMEFTTDTTPTVSTNAAIDITDTTATSGGTIASDGGDDVTARGVCWNMSGTPTTDDNHTSDGTGIGSFTSFITGLSPFTTYHVRAYATNGAGAAYGAEVDFVTLSPPTITTTVIIVVTGYAATSGGNITNDGGATVTAKGVCWSMDTVPTIDDAHTIDGMGTGSFISSITGLSPSTTYHVRAYATNAVGTAYGNNIMFNTLTLPTLTTAAITGILGSSAMGGGKVIDEGDKPVSVRGVCWSTTTSPTTDDSHTSDETGPESFTSNITGLSTGTKYYVRAYATSEVGTAYGDEKDFTTLTLPTVSTLSAVDAGWGSVTLVTGNISSAGGGTVSSRGVCWSSWNGMPTLADSVIQEFISGIGEFTIPINPDYGWIYIRAFAINEVGTAYGEVLYFEVIN